MRIRVGTDDGRREVWKISGHLWVKFHSLHIGNRAGLEPMLEGHLPGLRQPALANSCDNTSESNELSL